MTSPIVGMAAELNRQKKVQDDNAIIDVLPIVARYTSNSGQSIANGTPQVVNFEDVDFDPRSTVTTGASWVFTCPVAGYYLIAARVSFAGTTAWANGENCYLDVYINGAVHSRLWQAQYLGSTSSSVVAPNGTTLAHLDRDDTVDIRVLQASGGALALATVGERNHVNIARITP